MAAEEQTAEQKTAEQIAAEQHGAACLALGRFLGHQGSVARGMVAELTAEETEAILAAASDKDTAREQIKAILSRAYDRRREAAAKEANAVVTAARSGSEQTPDGADETQPPDAHAG